MINRLFALLGIVILLFGTAIGYAQEDKTEQEKKIDELIGNLGTRYWEKAADDLVEIGEATVERLIETLNIGSGRPSQNANFVLVRIGTSKAVDAVIGALQNPKFDFRVRANAAGALGEIGSKDVISPLIEALQTDSHWWVRHFAVGALGKIGSESVVEPIIGVLNDENQYVRRAALAVLGEIQSDKAIFPLIDCFKDEDWQIRLQAPDILQEFGNKIEIPLLKALDNDDKWVKVGAASVLGKIGSEAAVFPLISLIEDQERMVYDEAAVALSRINSKRSVKALLKMLKHETSYVREEAAWVLGEMRSKDAVGFLIQILDDEDMGWMAAVSLGKIGDERAVEPLKKKIADQNSRVGKAAAWALARMLIDEIENS